MISIFDNEAKTAFCCLVLALASTLGCNDASSASPVGSSPAAKPTDHQPEPPPSAAHSPSGNSETPAADSVTAPTGPLPSHDQPAAAVPTAEQPSAPTGQRPPADRSTTKPGDAEKITWEDVNLGMQADVVFRPFMISDRVKELEGKRISIVGYMHGGQGAQRGIKKFILLKNTQCKFGPGGQADHLADVVLKPDSGIAFTPSPIKVEGTLVLEPFEGPDGNTWSIYRVEAAQIR